jgi:hypothetical protein
MAASKNKIREWVDRGVTTGATHVIIVYDRWDYEDFPVYVDKDQSVEEKVASYNGKNMCSVMEVYDLSIDIDTQMNERRAWHF